MARFEPAFEKMIHNEGGYVLHTVSGDRGGMTYAGIARKYHPDWQGWGMIDSGETDHPEMPGLVRDFYIRHFWYKVRGDELSKQGIAETLFDFAVNAGVRTASRLAQQVVGASADGIIGPQSVAKMDATDEALFVARYALAKIARYAEICSRDPSQKKFLLGWLNRTLNAMP